MRRALAMIGLVTSLAGIAAADLFAGFSGIAPLLQRTDATAVIVPLAEIAIVDGKEVTREEYLSRLASDYDPTTFTRSSADGLWRVRVVRPLKGHQLDNVTTTTMTLARYPLHRNHGAPEREAEAIDRLSAMPGLGTDGIVPGQTYLAFLTQQSRDLSFRNVNASGSLIPVSPAFGKNLNETETHDGALLTELIIRESEEHPDTILGNQ